MLEYQGEAELELIDNYQLNLLFKSKILCIFKQIDVK
jgi:hypothetical protein